MWDAAKTVLKVKSVALNANIRETDAFEERHRGTPKEQVFPVVYAH